MKKLIAILALGFAGTAFAQNFVTIDVEQSQGLGGMKDSTVQKIQAGKSFGDTQLSLQSRTAVAEGGGMRNSLELYVADAKINFAGFKPFVGIGHDNGFNGGAGKDFQYGILGATAGTKIGTGMAMLGVKTRVNWDSSLPKQTAVGLSYNLPVGNKVDLRFTAGKSWQTIKENAYGVGVGFRF